MTAAPSLKVPVQVPLEEAQELIPDGLEETVPPTEAVTEIVSWCVKVAVVAEAAPAGVIEHVPVPEQAAEPEFVLQPVNT